MERFTIYEGYMEDLMKKVRKIQKKCGLYGNDFHFEEVGEEFKKVVDDETKKETLYRYVIVEAEGTAKINDWEFVGTIDHTPKGNIFNKAMTHLEIPERYRNCPPNCEHCHSKRNRSDTFIVHNTVTDEFKQVGRACLADYTRGMSVQYATWIASLRDIFEEAEEVTPSRCGRGEPYYDTEKVLRYAAETIRHYGYLSDSTKELVKEMFAVGEGLRYSYFYPISSRVREVKDMMEKCGFDANSEASVKMVMDALEWLSNQSLENNYMNNLSVVTSLEAVKAKEFGLLISLFPTYNRDLVRQEQRKAEAEQGKLSEYVGNVGDKIEFEVQSVRCLTSWDNCYNGYSTTTTYIWELKDLNNNIFTWKTSNYLNADKPPKVIRGTIKAHKEFREVKQTEITRCRELEQLTPEKKRKKSNDNLER